MWVIALAPLVRAAEKLPVFLADNHAETFGWITRTFDPDDAFTLVLVDAHSDASAAERSEELREQLRRVPSRDARAALVEKWRAGGRIQAFNWIEPLMPRPLEQVHWLSRISAGDAITQSAEAIAALDGRLEIEPRSAGSFSNRWETSDLQAFQSWDPGQRPLILAIDLDFFAGMDATQRDEAFQSIWSRAMTFSGLKGIAFCVSRPWLKDDPETEALVRLALDSVRHTRGAVLEIDASLDDRPDHSLNADELRLGGLAIPRWDLAAASPGTKALLGLLGARVTLKDRLREWKTEKWTPSATITPESGEIDTDGTWRFPMGKEPVLRLSAPADATGRVRWRLLQSTAAAYDLLPATGLGKGFSEKPSRWIYEKSSSIGETTDFLLAPAAWKQGTGGTFRISAEYETSAGWMPAGPVELRIRNGDGFRGALSECQGMPYVFGIAGVSTNDLSGVESGWGSDCSNLLIYAWRRNGIPLAWGDPGRLRQQLSAKAENIRLTDDARITPLEIERGIAIDFGKHVAALWEDRPPLGILGGNDLVMHHLGGRPEILPLEKLASSRPVFSLQVPRQAEAVKATFAGDIVLAGDDPVEIPGVTLGESDLFFANLEGIPSPLEPEHQPRYDFRFPPERLSFLKDRKISAVSLANNHALDAGPEGLLDGLQALRSLGIPSVGAGGNESEASSPLRFENGGTKLAVFGICHVGTGAAGPGTSGICMLPHHSAILEAEFRKALARRERVVVLLHGGDEYETEVNEAQRRWARWLVARGASLIAGAHPHVLQREEIHGGATILHSLGNAVYPRSLKGADSGKVRILEIPAANP